MPLDDSQTVIVTFACCGEKRDHKFGALKTGTMGDGFACPACGTGVKYNGYEFVRLMNEEALDATHKITLYPVKE
jgi:hypothetical protein